MSADLEEEAREAALRILPKDDKPLGSFMGGVFNTKGDRERLCIAEGYLAAATARDKELVQLREMVDMLLAKLEAVPVEEIARGASALRLYEPKLPDGKQAGDTIDRWLATVTKPIPLPEGEGDAR